MNATPQQRYVIPTGVDRVFNKTVGALTRAGISVYGSRVLAVRGRKSGEWRTTPVNPLIVDGQRYLVAPRGQAQWVRNMRAAGSGELRVGRRTEPFSATELADADKPPVLREYLRKWGWEVGRFFEGVTKDASDEQLVGIAPGFPVFKIRPSTDAALTRTSAIPPATSGAPAPAWATLHPRYTAKIPVLPGNGRDAGVISRCAHDRRAGATRMRAGR